MRVLMVGPGTVDLKVEILTAGTTRLVLDVKTLTIKAVTNKADGQPLQVRSRAACL